MVAEGEWSDRKWEEMCANNTQHERQRSRHRSYCFTLNNPQFNELTHMLENIEANYWCFGFETGQSGTKHLQGYVQYSNPTEFNSAKSQISARAHLEPAKGTPSQNRTYCSKDGEFHEFGDVIPSGPKPRTKTWEDIQAAMADPKANPGTYSHYKRAYQSIIQDSIKNRESVTQYYCITPIEDVITEVHTHFGTIPDLVVVEDLSELAEFEDPKNILLLESTCGTLRERTINLFPRGKSISYRHGYELCIVKPDRFIIETSNKNLFPLYRNI